MRPLRVRMTNVTFHRNWNSAGASNSSVSSVLPDDSSGRLRVRSEGQMLVGPMFPGSHYPPRMRSSGMGDASQPAVSGMNGTRVRPT